jgi:hypothetical protein
MAIRARLLGLRQGYPSLNTRQLVEKAGYVIVEKLVLPRFPKPDPLSETFLLTGSDNNGWPPPGPLLTACS